MNANASTMKNYLPHPMLDEEKDYVSEEEKHSSVSEIVNPVEKLSYARRMGGKGSPRTLPIDPKKKHSNQFVNLFTPNELGEKEETIPRDQIRQNLRNDIHMKELERTKVSERYTINYSEDDIELIQSGKKKITSAIHHMEVLYKHKYGNGKLLLYPNQLKYAEDIIKNLKDENIFITIVLALTQSGKTGIMLATIKKYMEDPDVMMRYEHIYVITGLSSKEWKQQTKDRLPECLHDNVYHLQDLCKKKMKELFDKENVLIIMDEIQVAAKENLTLDKKLFEKCGYNDINVLREKNVNIVQFTATPDGVISDLMNWEKGSVKKIQVQPEPTSGYISCFDLYRKGKVKQSKTLSEPHIRELQKEINSFSTPRYHIVRLHTDKFEQNVNMFKTILGENCTFYEYNEKNKKNPVFINEDNFDINQLLTKPPKKHTVIFIKEMLRCAKTIHKEYLGLLYERFTSNDSVNIQGLLGRATGYDVNLDIIIYTNIKSIKRYADQWNSSFDEKYPWNSGSTARSGDKTVSKGTFGVPSSIDNQSADENTDKECRIFDTQDEAIHFAKNTLNVTFNSRNNDKAPEDLFKKHERNPTSEELLQRMWGLNQKNKARMIPTEDAKWCVYWRPSFINNSSQ